MTEDRELEARAALARLAGLTRLWNDLPDHATPLVLKGWSLTGSLYPILAQRRITDIDLLFATEDEARSHHAHLQTLGWEPYLPQGEDAWPGTHHHLVPLHHPASPLRVEIHLNLTQPPLPAPFISALVAESLPGTLAGRAVRFPHRPGALLHHALHILNDPVSGPFLRNLAEWAALLHAAPPADRDATREAALAHDRPGVIALSHLAHRWFDVPALASNDPGHPAIAFLEERLEHLPPYSTLWRAQREVMRHKIDALHAERSGSTLKAIQEVVHDWRQARSEHKSSLPDRPQRPDLPWRRIGEVVVVQGRDGEAHILNDTAGAVWEALDGTRSVAELAADPKLTDVREIGATLARDIGLDGD